MKARLVALLLLWSAAAPAAELPGDSLYQLRTPLTTQDGQPAVLDLYRGRPTLISLFYASCPNVCPMLVASLQQIERQLPEPERARLRVILVSIDPENDTPAALKELAQRHRADLTRWTFARSSPAELRKLAAALGIQYRRLQDGNFNHSTIITLLDADGRMRQTTSRLGAPDAAFVGVVREALGH